MIGDRIFRDAPALLLLIFMTNYLAIPPALAGVAIFLPKTLIIFVDPIVGVLSDRLNTRWGASAPTHAGGRAPDEPQRADVLPCAEIRSRLPSSAYMSFIVFVGFAGYSLYSVPYLTMASELASDDDERRKIMSWRVVFMAIGLSISAFAGGFVQSIGGGREGLRDHVLGVRRDLLGHDAVHGLFDGRRRDRGGRQ